MLFFGHIAASLIIADATDTDRAAAIAGNLTPDVVDKTGSVLLHLMPRRWIAHGLPFYALVCLVLRPLLSQRQWRAYVLGYAGHLFCDLWAGGKVPWFAPFEPQRRYSRRRSLGRWLLYLLPELVGGYVTYRRLAFGPNARQNQRPLPSGRGLGEGN